eukprot:523603_1
MSSYGANNSVIFWNPAVSFSTKMIFESLWLTSIQQFASSETNPIVLYLCKIILFDIIYPIYTIQVHFNKIGFGFQLKFDSPVDALCHLCELINSLVDWIDFVIQHIVDICDIFKCYLTGLIEMLVHHNIVIKFLPIICRIINLGPRTLTSNNTITRVFIIKLYSLFRFLMLVLLMFTYHSLATIHFIALVAMVGLQALCSMMWKFTFLYGLQLELQILLSVLDTTLPHDIIQVIHEYILMDSDENDLCELMNPNESVKRLRELEHMNLEFVVMRCKTRVQYNNITWIERVSWKILSLWFNIIRTLSAAQNMLCALSKFRRFF